MINLTDAGKLAKNKFKQRKVRSIFSGCVMALPVTVVMLVVILSTGISDVISKVFLETYKDRYFASIQYTGGYSENPCEIKDEECKTLQKVFTSNNKNLIANIIKNKYAKFNIKDINFTDSAADEYSIHGLKELFDSSKLSRDNIDPTNFALNVGDPVHVQYSLWQEVDLTKTQDNLIPVVLRGSLFEPQAWGYYELSSEEAYKWKLEHINKVKGQIFDLDLLQYAAKTEMDFITRPAPKTKPTGIKIIVVGVINTNSFAGLLSGSMMYTSVNALNNIYVSPEVVKNNPAVSKLLEKSSISEISIEFFNSQTRDQFVTNLSTTNFGLQDSAPLLRAYGMINSLDGIKELVSVVKQFLLCLGSVLFTLGGLIIFFFVGKITSDSKKEIAVYRAFGANKGDIRRIFWTFTAILGVFSFILGTIIAVLGSLALSANLGREIIYSITNLAATYNNVVEIPAWALVKIPILETMGVLLVTLLITFIASLWPIINVSRTPAIDALRDE